MTTDERKLVIDLATQRLSKAAFLSRFRDSTDGQQLCGELLTEAVLSREADDVECALIVGFIFGFSCSHIEPLLELVTAPWHVKHEDVVTALGQLRSPQAVAGLRSATKWIPEYLEFDESRALAVKAVWALGRIETTEAEAVLLELANDPNPVVAAAAKKQMARRQTE